MDLARIRNFSIIAHVDHGKSTLADRILEVTGAVSSREKREQFLDQMDLERERGITIKASPVRLTYRARDGRDYLLNLIDTPGHVDFSYEVSRSLRACEGALLVVDASQGVEAQTLANAYLALENDLEIVPVLNKIDLPQAEPERVAQEIEEVVGLPAAAALRVSAKLGTGVPEILEEIVRTIPPPTGSTEGPLRALIFDSWYDAYQGVVAVVRVFDGKIRSGLPVLLMGARKTAQVQKVGVFSPGPREVDELAAGEVGFVTAALKDVSDVRIGDTLTDAARPTPEPLPGFKVLKPMVFAGIYPVETNEYEGLRDALAKLRLNDASFVYEPESSLALGFGFRCGFLGLLHMEIVRERLQREFDLNLLATTPSVAYRVTLTSGEVVIVESPAKLPAPEKIEKFEEPIVRATLHTPSQFLGGIFALCEEKRGVQKEVRYFSAGAASNARVVVVYELPLGEILLDFYDRLKSLTRGYASLDYEFLDYREADLVKLDILINGDAVDALSVIVHKERAYGLGRDLTAKMKELIPRQMFEVAIQAAIGGRVIARETRSALRKNVTAKCYGGDITRKRKLLERQKEGKKRMKQVGQVEIPQEAFLALLKVGGGEGKDS